MMAPGGRGGKRHEEPVPTYDGKILGLDWRSPRDGDEEKDEAKPTKQASGLEEPK